MFSVVYSFKIKPNKKEEFLKSWEELTQLIIKHEGGLGSRIHRLNEEEYIAYAQWPNRDRWEKSGANLPESADEIRKQMRETCQEIKTIYELDVIKDLLSQEIK